MLNYCCKIVMFKNVKVLKVVNEYYMVWSWKDREIMFVLVINILFLSEWRLINDFNKNILNL